MPNIADSYVSTAGLALETGTATSTVSAGACNVTVGDAITSVLVVRDLTVGVGDVLLIGRIGSSPVAIARLFAAAPPAPPDNNPGPAPKPVVVTGALSVTPVTTQTYRNGKWRTDDPDVFQGVAPSSSFGSNTGCAFYGGKPRSLAGATVTRATIRVRRERGGIYAAQTATLWLVTQANRPVGAPTLTSSTTGPTLPALGTEAQRTNNAFVVPTSWVQAMVDGTAGGLAVFVSDGQPYIQFAGRSLWAPAWTLKIEWSRTT